MTLAAYTASHTVIARDGRLSEIARAGMLPVDGPGHLSTLVLRHQNEIRHLSVYARNRILLKGRRLESTMGGAGVYRITWEVENEVTSVDVEGWHPDALPGQVVEEFRPVYSDLMLEVRTGLIR